MIPGTFRRSVPEGWIGPISVLNAKNRPTVVPVDPETKRWANVTEFEDPTVWMDNRGNYHVITHAYVPVRQTTTIY